MYKKNLTAVLICFLILPCSLFAQSPGGIRDQLCWLQGNFSSDAARQKVLNFNPAMVMDNNKTIIKMPAGMESLRKMTVFTVYQNPADEEKTVWEMNGEPGNILLSTQRVLSKNRKTSILFAKNKPGSHTENKPGAIINTYLVRKYAWDGAENTYSKQSFIQFGNSNSRGSVNPSAGMIPEFILYGRILSEEEIAKIETYLALKYGITLEKNYLNTPGKTVWSWQNDQLYSHNIAGIARDDESTLYQKQATGYNNSERLVIGVNTIVQSNNENKGSVNNGDYLIWGDNAGDFTLNANDEGCDSKIILPAKRWLMKSTGSTAGTISTELKIDIKTLLTGHFSKDSLCLFIDRTGSGDFAPGNCTCIMPDSISAEGIAIFKNLFWDTDGSGKDHFTVGFKTQENKGSKNKNNSGISFQVYPNPTSDGYFKIAITLNKSMDVRVMIYDINQQLVDSKKGAGHDSYLFSEYINKPAGAYTVKLLTPESELSRIIIVR